MYTERDRLDITNEIDISLFLKILWNSKKLILSSMIILLCLSLLYSKLSPRYWLNNMNIYSSNIIYPIEILDVNNINISYSKDDITQLYLESFNDVNNKKKFINDNKKIADIDLIDRVIISKDAKDNTDAVYQVSYKSKNKMINDVELVKYTKFVETIVLNKIRGNVNIKKNEILKKLNNDLTFANILAKENRNTEINKNKYALEVAKSASIEKPIFDNIDNYNIPISQGVLVLESNLKMLTNAQDLSVFNLNINMIKSKVAFIKQNVFNVNEINIISNSEFNFTSELKTTNYRSNSFISIILGFFIGVFFVFSKYLFENK